MDSLLYLADLCKYSYWGETLQGNDFSDAKVFEIASSKMVTLKRDNSLIICVTGTDSLEDCIIDTDLILEDLIIQNKNYGKVHRGFFRYLMRLWPIIQNEIGEFLHEYFLFKYDMLNSLRNSSSDIIKPPVEGDKDILVIGNNERRKTISSYVLSDIEEDEVQIESENDNIQNHKNEDIKLIEKSCESVDTSNHSFKMKISNKKIFKLQTYSSSVCDSNSWPSVVFTGHSLGSSCAYAALLAAIHFKDRLHLRCVTFASPKLGDSVFVKNFCNYVPCNFRVIHNHDVVTMFPFGILKITRPYKHINNEVRLGSHGNYVVKNKRLLSLLCSTFLCCSDLNEQFIYDHKIDRYIEAIKNNLDTITKYTEKNSAIIANTIGTIERLSPDHDVCKNAH